MVKWRTDNINNYLTRKRSISNNNITQGIILEWENGTNLILFK